MIIKTVYRSMQKCIELIYPAICRDCGCFVEGEKIFCSSCEQRITPVVSLILPITANVSCTVHAVGSYCDPLRLLVLKKRVFDIRAAKDLGVLVLQKTQIRSHAIDYVVPIPLHWSRKMFRGYNQAAIMAAILARACSVPTISLLRRVKRTFFQSTLSPSDRQKNVKEAFSLNSRHINKIQHLCGKNIVLIDDLCTTGATLQNAAKSLLVLKPASLTAFVACRAM